MGFLRVRILGLRRPCSTYMHLSQSPFCVLTITSAAGAETTSAAMAWWMLAMVTYPDVQKRAQEELDSVVGRTRIPNFADLPHLPYIRAMVKEALRWRPVDPLGLPHLSTEDDWYNGMFIPKGSIMIANVWNLNRDTEIYGADAAQFNPARFLDTKGGVRSCAPETKEEGHVTYGFGRRVCVGKHVANNSLFIDFAMMLWACKIEPGKDERGNVIPIDVDGCIEDGLVVWVLFLHSSIVEPSELILLLTASRPVPFKVDISPRFPEAVALLAAENEFESL
jgi:hypothetical protein